MRKQEPSSPGGSGNPTVVRTPSGTPPNGPSGRARLASVPPSVPGAGAPRAGQRHGAGRESCDAVRLFMAELDRFRERRSLTHKQLAGLAGMRLQTLHDWLSGKRQSLPDWTEVERIVRALGLDTKVWLEKHNKVEWELEEWRRKRKSGPSPQEKRGLRGWAELEAK
jgi:transcriptional regulator with XRE-family HTH domain